MVGTLTGVVGRVEWGYNPAASVNNYTITRTKNPHTAAKTWRLRATVVMVNQFNMAQRPLRFVAPHKNGQWEWMIRRVMFPGGVDYPPPAPFTFTAELDPPHA